MTRRQKLKQTEAKFERTINAAAGVSVEATANPCAADWSLCGAPEDVEKATRWLENNGLLQKVREEYDEEDGYSVAFYVEA